ncbi:MAG: MFS transporter [Actinobacteria bacterium HGW-Actinobacteria-2]|nr:MAG: MFS transporter [Actinobacteria bacterium HGW-Actinobacteria-2]
MSATPHRPVLAILGIAIALSSLDSTMVNVALPSIQATFDAPTPLLQWVVDAYAVTFAGTLLLAGSLGDRFGRRRILVIGLTIFMLADIGAMLSTAILPLAIFRAVIGVAAAFILPAALGIIIELFPDPHERAAAIGVWAGVTAIGVAIGPIVGGLLVEYFSWSAVFALGPPIAAVVLVLALRYVPESQDPDQPRLDVLGAVLSSLGLAALIVFVIEVAEFGIKPLTIALATAAVVLLAVFGWWQTRVAKPLLSLELFRVRAFTVSLIIVALVYLTLMGTLFLLPQFLQLVHGMSPLISGLALLPGALAQLIASLLSPRLADRIGVRNTIVAGLAVVLVGFLLFSTVTLQTPYAVVAVCFVLIGTGLGLVLPEATHGAMSLVPHEHSGVGAAVNDAVGDIGGTFGVATLGAVMAATYHANIEAAIEAAGSTAALLPPNALEALRSSLTAATVAAQNLPAEYALAFREIAGHAYVSGLGWALSLGAGVTVVGIAIAWFGFPKNPHKTA